MTPSSLCRAIIESFEALRLQSYQDQRGFWTIGYGHKNASVKEGMTCTPEQADEWLAEDLRVASAGVTLAVTRPLRQHEFDALVSFTFNVGVSAFTHSTLLTLVNTTQSPQAADEFLIWNHVDGTVDPGLSKRRRLERALFLDGASA